MQLPLLRLHPGGESEEAWRNLCDGLPLLMQAQQYSIRRRLDWAARDGAGMCDSTLFGLDRIGSRLL